MVDETSSPSNARLPVTSSYSTQPKAQMSARLSTGLPRACSGAHVGGRPEDDAGLALRAIDTVGDVAASATRAKRAGVKRLCDAEIEQLHHAHGRSLMLAGLRSR